MIILLLLIIKTAQNTVIVVNFDTFCCLVVVGMVRTDVTCKIHCTVACCYFQSLL